MSFTPDPASTGSSPAAPLPLSVVAPCYNEQEVLVEFHRRVAEVCGKLGHDYEIVLVDDGSRDRTWPMMQELIQQDPHVVAVKLARNHGHQLALTAGLSVCRGERVLVIDADLQDPPELLPEMMRVMDQGADVVYGQRKQRAGESWFKLWTASSFYRFLNKLSDTPIPKDTGDFRLISRRALNILQAMPERHRFIRGMVSWIGFRQEPFLFDRDSRYAGETKYPLRKMLKLASDALVSFSMIPLKLPGYLAGITAAIGVVFLLFAALGLLGGWDSRGWLFLLAMMFILAAAQFCVLVIFGEYLGRAYDQGKGRPLFIIETIARKDAPLEA